MKQVLIPFYEDNSWFEKKKKERKNRKLCLVKTISRITIISISKTLLKKRFNINYFISSNKEKEEKK